MSNSEKTLSPGEREALEHIVKTYKDYKDFDPTNSTVLDWVLNAQTTLKEDEERRIISERDWRIINDRDC